MAGFLFGIPKYPADRCRLTLFIPPPMETGGGVYQSSPFLSGPIGTAGQGPPPFPAARTSFSKLLFPAPPAEAAFRLIPARDDGGVDRAPPPGGFKRASPHRRQARLCPAVTPPLPPRQGRTGLSPSGPPPPVALYPRAAPVEGRRKGLASFMSEAGTQRAFSTTGLFLLFMGGRRRAMSHHGDKSGRIFSFF